MQGFDLMDTAGVIATFGVSSVSLPLAVPVGALALGLYIARRSPDLQRYLCDGDQDMMTTGFMGYVFAPVNRKQLAAPRDADDDDGVSWNWKDVTGSKAAPKSKKDTAATDWYDQPATGETKRLGPVDAKTRMAAAVKRLPTDIIHLRTMQPPKSTTAIPVGIDQDGSQLWLDLSAGRANSVYHMQVTGTPGAGKDTLFKSWFRVLTARNTPDDIVFAIIDGKGAWALPWIKHNEFFFIPPASPNDDEDDCDGSAVKGDDGKVIKDPLERASHIILAEMRRRYKLITSAGCEDREEYLSEHPGETMPLLTVIVTDVMSEMDSGNILSNMIAKLVSKSRAAGIRVIVSMQTTTRQDTRWRSSLSAYISGQIEARQDSVVMGTDVEHLDYLPSQLPPAAEFPGFFVVRRGQQQSVVKAPYIGKQEFKDYCKGLRQRPENQNANQNARTQQNVLVEPEPDRQNINQNTRIYQNVLVKQEPEQGFDLLGVLVASVPKLTDQQRDDTVLTLARVGLNREAIREHLRKAGSSISNEHLADLMRQAKA